MDPDVNAVDPQEPVEPTEPQEPTEPIDPAEPTEPQEDYQGKLNATNRFLKKEGYTFDKEKKQWLKPATSPHPDTSTSGALSPEADARITRAELSALGIKDTDEQELVTSAAKRLGITVYEAANDEFIANKLERMRETKKTKQASPAPNRGGGSSRNTKLPDFSKMSNAEFDKWEKENRR